MCIIFVLLPVALLVSKLASKVADILNSAHEDNKESGSQGADDDGPLLLQVISCLLYTSPSPRDATLSRMPSSA